METLAQYGWPGAMVALIALIALIFKSYSKMATDIAIKSFEATNNFALAVKENTRAIGANTGAISALGSIIEDLKKELRSK